MNFELKYNLTGSDRKRLVTAMAELLDSPMKYKGAPTFAYEVDYFTIDKNGTVSFDDRADSEEIERLIERLHEQGFEAEPQDAPDDDVPEEAVDRETDEQDDEPEIGDGPHDVDDRGWP